MASIENKEIGVDLIAELWQREPEGLGRPEPRQLVIRSPQFVLLSSLSSWDLFLASCASVSSSSSPGRETSPPWLLKADRIAPGVLDY